LKSIQKGTQVGKLLLHLFAVLIAWSFYARNVVCGCWWLCVIIAFIAFSRFFASSITITISGLFSRKKWFL
jgi:hypothetical protein